MRISTTQKAVIVVLVVSAYFLLLGGCGGDDEQQQDIKQKEEIKNKTVCDQCAAYDCAGCQGAPLCVAKCGCDQCGNQTSDGAVGNQTPPLNVTINNSNGSGPPPGPPSGGPPST